LTKTEAKFWRKSLDTNLKKNSSSKNLEKKVLHNFSENNFSDKRFCINFRSNKIQTKIKKRKKIGKPTSSPGSRACRGGGSPGRDASAGS
jgi:hypothetical protein